MMQEELDSIDNEKPKRPNFLVALIVLSAISMVMNLYSSVIGVSSGVPTQAEREAYEATQYENINELKDQGFDGMAEVLEEVLVMTLYQNEHVYTSFYWLTLLYTLLGMVAIVLMFQLKKIGFHLYVLYSLAPILVTYLLIPVALIPSFIIIGSLIVSLLFCILYGLNLKHMK